MSHKNLSFLEECNETPDAIRFSADGKFIYLGFAFAGTTGLDGPTWKIKRVGIADSGDISFMYHNGKKDNYNLIFDQCETYDYKFHV